jgi:hypothetical protein
MAHTRLTLSVDEDVARRAREYAASRQTSISRLVNAFLAGLGDAEPSACPPVIRRLMGILPDSADESGYRDHLEEKYGA